MHHPRRKNFKYLIRILSECPLDAEPSICSHPAEDRARGRN